MLSLKSFGNFWGNLYIACLWVIIPHRLTCGEKKNLVERQKVSKYYENDCLQNFILLMSLLTDPICKNSHA